MKIPPALQILSVWLLVTVVGAVLTMTRADATEVPEPRLALDSSSSVSAVTPEPESASASALDDDVTPTSLNQCAAGYFCVWTQANYTGALQRFKTQGQYMSIVVSRVGSFYNNRSKRVFIYGDSSGSPSACYGAYAKRNNTSSWITYAEGTYLSTATSC